MNNQKGNQNNLSPNNNNVLNKNISTPVESNKVNNTTNQDSSSQVQDSLKEFNATPIDTPTPISLDDNLSAPESLEDESILLEETKTQLNSDDQELLDSKNQLEAQSEYQTKPDIEPKIESVKETIPVLPSEPKPELETSNKLIDIPETKPEPEIETKTENPIPTETKTPNLVSEDPEAIKQKIEEVLSYNTADSVTNSQPEKPKTSRFLKTIFTFSLITFIAVFAALAYFYFNPISKTNTESTTKPTETTGQSSVPTQSDVVCELNGFTYNLNQSFPSADGCNLCTCVSADNIVCTEKSCADVTTTPATSSSIPKDWKNYTDSTYKFSISYPSEWVLDKGDDWFTIKSPDGDEEEKRIKSEPASMEGYPMPCGYYFIHCQKSFSLSPEIPKNFKSLESWLKSDYFSNFTQSTINGHVLYSVINSSSLNGGDEFYIQNKDSSYCYIRFCGSTKELTPTEKQFVNSFKFN